MTGFSGLHFEDWDIARNIVEHGSYSEFISVGPTAYKLPMYPLFLSVFMYLFPHNYAEIIVVVQHFIFFLVPIFIILILKIFNKKDSGILAGYIFIFSPAYFYYSNVYEVTNIFISIFLVWIFVYLKIFAGHFKKRKYFVLLGVCTAVLFLTQVIVAPLVSLLLFSLIFYRTIHWKSILITCCIAVICYSPWIVRNYITFDKFIPTKTPVWQNIYLSYTPAPNIWKDLNIISEKDESITFEERRIVNEFDMELVYQRKVENALKGNQSKVIKKAVQNALLIWTVPSRYFYDNSLNILLGRKFFLLIIHALSIISLVHFYKNGKRLMVSVFLLVFVSFTIPYMIGHASNMRFKLDFEWLQYILVALYILDISRALFFRIQKNIN